MYINLVFILLALYLLMQEEGIIYFHRHYEIMNEDYIFNSIYIYIYYFFLNISCV